MVFGLDVPGTVQKRKQRSSAEEATANSSAKVRTSIFSQFKACSVNTVLLIVV